MQKWNHWWSVATVLVATTLVGCGGLKKTLLRDRANLVGPQGQTITVSNATREAQADGTFKVSFKISDGSNDAELSMKVAAKGSAADSKALSSSLAAAVEVACAPDQDDCRALAAVFTFANNGQAAQNGVLYEIDPDHGDSLLKDYEIKNSSFSSAATAFSTLQAGYATLVGSP